MFRDGHERAARWASAMLRGVVSVRIEGRCAGQSGRQATYLWRNKKDSYPTKRFRIAPNLVLSGKSHGGPCASPEGGAKSATQAGLGKMWKGIESPFRRDDPAPTVLPFIYRNSQRRPVARIDCKAHTAPLRRSYACASPRL